MAGAKKPGPWREWGGGAPWGGAFVPIGRPSVRPDFGGRGGFDPETNSLWGIRTPWNQPGRPFFSEAGELLDSLLARFEHVADPDQLEALIRKILGPQCFTLGVFYGAGEAFVMSIVDLLKLLKTFLLADLYDATRRNPSWTMWHPGGIARYLTAQMLSEYIGEEMLEAARERDGLIAELKAIFESPGEFFGKAGDQYAKKFEKFVALAADPGLESQFQAGRIFGEVLLEVVGLIAGGAAVLKGVSKIPRLAKLGRLLKGRVTPKVRVASAVTETEAGASTPVARRSSGPVKEPKPAVEQAATTASVPKLPPEMAEKILYGTKNADGDIIGAHSPQILNRPDFRVKVLETYPDGTMKVKVEKLSSDGVWEEKPFPSTLPPKSWSDAKIIQVTEELAAGEPVGIPRTDGSRLFARTVDGVQWVVIKGKGGTASYPSQKLPGGFGL